MTGVGVRRVVAAVAATVIAGTGLGATPVAAADTAGRGQGASAERTSAATTKKRSPQRIVRRPAVSADPQGDVSPEDARRHFSWSQYINKP